MLPAQDILPEGGLGNLIALPLQGQALKNGNSAFVDENWNAYPDQWSELRNVKKYSKSFIVDLISEWTQNGILGVLSKNNFENDKNEKDVKPWKKKDDSFKKEDIDGMMSIVVANRLFIDTNNLKPRLQNRIRRLAAYSNPEFYKTQAMGYSVRGIPRIIGCSQDIDDYISLPRGCGYDIFIGKAWRYQ